MNRIGLLILFLFLSVRGFGQYSFSASTSGAITVGSTMIIGMSAGSSVSSTVGSVSAMSNSVTATNNASFTVKSNELWLITMRANTANFTPGGSGSTNMPCSIVGIRVNGSSTFTHLSTTDQTLKTGNRGNTSTSGNSFNIDMNFNPGFSYKGDVYTLSVIYTISKQ